VVCEIELERCFSAGTANEMGKFWLFARSFFGGRRRRAADGVDFESRGDSDGRNALEKNLF
jgi:hypothetical protein